MIQIKEKSQIIYYKQLDKTYLDLNVVFYDFVLS